MLSKSLARAAIIAMAAEDVFIAVCYACGGSWKLAGYWALIAGVNGIAATF